MARPGSLPWLFRHEFRLGWRSSFLGRGRRGGVLVLVLAAPFVQLAGIGLAFVMTHEPAPLRTAVLTLACGLAALAMLSQSILAAVEALHARADLDLLFSSPLRVAHVLTLRMAAIAASVAPLWLGLGGALANGFLVFGRTRFLAIYAVMPALAMLASAAAVCITLGLLSLAGPRRTRLVATVASSLVGLITVLSTQARSILPPREFDAVVEWVSAPPGWWLGRAASGDPVMLPGLVALALIAFGGVAEALGGRFARGASVSAAGRPRPARAPAAFQAGRAVLLVKEWRLLARHPGALMQAMVQYLGYLPLALLLWRSGAGTRFGSFAAIIVLVAGHVARTAMNVAVNYDQAGDLARTAPVRMRVVRRAKWLMAGRLGLAVAGPTSLALALVNPVAGAIALGLSAPAIACELAANLWSPAKPAQALAGRKMTPSAGTYVSLVTGLLWPFTAVLAVNGNPWAVVPGAIASVMVWPLRPSGEPG